ncbi:putative glyoxal reductase [Ancylostoma caninum]|uniref:Putative glyoxal reductase n=1 Tax=Ancylostoma caninum TaxID=29170 RepID=A0A368GDZ1_ANCCA|nr:putative glyoxal reductase [Ancylostoma caninum]
MTSGRDYVREKMPILGFGTYQIRNESTLHGVVDAALSCGYRFFDTAQVYGNEAALGRIFKELLPKYDLEREDIFITSKVSPANQGTDLARKSIKKSLANLQTDYIDLMLIHWPGVSKKAVADKQNPVKRRQTYEVLEEYHDSGELRAIGVSNYEIRHLEELLEHCKVHPAVNQVEFHPHFHQLDLLDFCKAHDIHFQAYSSFGGPDYRDKLFNDPDVQQLAAKYKITVPQFLLAWATSQSISVLPRTTNPERVAPNLEAKDVKISSDDVQKLLDNGKCHKACWDPSVVV